jgi:hypothetical protein
MAEQTKRRTMCGEVKPTIAFNHVGEVAPISVTISAA